MLLSRSSDRKAAGVDRGDKFYEYEEAGVKEYWLIDPPEKAGQFYGIESDGAFISLHCRRTDCFNSRQIKGLCDRCELALARTRCPKKQNFAKGLGTNILA